MTFQISSIIQSNVKCWWLTVPTNWCTFLIARLYVVSNLIYIVTSFRTINPSLESQCPVLPLDQVYMMTIRTIIYFFCLSLVLSDQHSSLMFVHVLFHYLVICSNIWTHIVAATLILLMSDSYKYNFNITPLKTVYCSNEIYRHVHKYNLVITHSSLIPLVCCNSYFNWASVHEDIKC